MKELKKILLFLGIGFLLCFLLFVSVPFGSLLYQFIYHKFTTPSWNNELEQLIPNCKISIQSAIHSNMGGYHAEFHIFIPSVWDRKEFIKNMNKIGENYIFHMDVMGGHTHYNFYKEGYGVSIEDCGNGTFFVKFDDFSQAQFDYIKMSKYSKS